jgi:hypothetical protein
MITIVSGLPRTGTSMMMRFLEAGGLEALTDGVREADADNPRGYYELERAKTIREDSSWLDEAEGKVFKMVSLLLFHLPPERNCKIILMRRDLDEVLASQAVMLSNLGKDQDQPPDEKMKALFTAHLAEVEQFLHNRPALETLQCDFRRVVENPIAVARQVADHLGLDLDLERMAATIEPELYRQRRG